MKHFLIGFLLGLFFLGATAWADGVSFSGPLKKLEPHVFVLGKDITIRVTPDSQAEQWLESAQGMDVRVVVESIWR